jgi:hypothetical protein
VLYARGLLPAIGYAGAAFVALALTMVIVTRPRPAVAPAR